MTPEERFEANKLRNFRASSNLEGLPVSEKPVTIIVGKQKLVDVDPSVPDWRRKQYIIMRILTTHIYLSLTSKRRKRDGEKFDKDVVARLSMWAARQGIPDIVVSRAFSHLVRVFYTFSHIEPVHRICTVMYCKDQEDIHIMSDGIHVDDRPGKCVFICDFYDPKKPHKFKEAQSVVFER